MNLDDIRKAIVIQDRQIQISAATLNDLPFAEQTLFRFYESNPLVIKAAQGSNGPTINDDGLKKIEIQGQTTLPSLHLEDVEMRAIFELNKSASHDEDMIVVTLQYTLLNANSEPGNWVFSQSFPELHQTGSLDPAAPTQRLALDGLQLRESCFVLTTASHQNEEFGIHLQPGLNFVGKWMPTEILGLFESLLESTKPLTLFGPIMLPITNIAGPPLPPGKFPWDPDIAQPPGIHLEASLGITLGFGKLTLNETRFQLYSATSFDWQLANPDYVPVIAVTGSIDISDAGPQRFTALKQLGLDTLLIEGEFSGISLDGLAKLGDLAGGDVTEGIPEDIRSRLKQVTLQNIALNLVPQESSYTVEYINLAIGLTAVKWIVFEDVLVIDNIMAGLVVYSPFNSSRRISGYLAGRADIAGVAVDVKIGVPNFYIYASLGAAQSLPLQVFFSKYLPGIPQPTDLTINRITILAIPGSSYDFALGMAEKPAWEIDLGSKQLTIHNVQLGVSNTSGQADASKTTGMFSGILSFAGVDVSVSTTVTSGPNGGWQFQGSTGPGQEIPIGDLIDDLAEQFGADKEVLPASIVGLIIQNLHVSFNTQTKDFTFGCEAKFPVEEREVDILVTIELKQTEAGYRKRFGGVITVGELQFALQFAQDAAATAFAATYSHKGDGRLKVGALIGKVFTLGGELSELLDALEIDLKDLLFVYQTTQTGVPATKQSTFLFGLDIGASISLSNLPLVGKEFPPGQSAGVDNLRLLVASADLKQAEVNAINDLLPAGIAKIAAAAPAQTGQAAGDQGGTANDAVLKKGATVAAQLNFGGTPQTLALPLASAGATASPSGGPRTEGVTVRPTPKQPVGVTSTDSAKWFTLQKTFGPLELQRVGVQYKDAVLWFLLDAALSAAGLSLSLEGLALGSPITKFEPRFDLRGLGIAYRNEAVEISGAFLRTRVVPAVGSPYDEFAGAAVVKAKALTLSAIGSYAYVDGHPSLFVYAVLDYPIGGPSFFFVTGLAGGFGYNRALIVPPIEGVAAFPLVAMAMKSDSQDGAGSAAGTDQGATGDVPSPAKRLTDVLEQLRVYIPASIGDYFLAVGIKFTSFKIIDSFVLLTVAFGHRFELNVLGLSTVVVPPVLPGAEGKIEPLAQIQMAVKASFIPDQGFLGVSAQLTAASYILSRACHLTGGFAFYAWFDGPHTGDFALTLGGYHPSYKVPAHYPRVPRLGINWQVDARLAIKGELYFALTPAALMAGGQLQATWDSGNLKAWFQMGADFIIAWQPYSYDARAYASLRVSYTFQFFGTQRLSFDASAEMHLWGPEFSGTAHIKVSIVEFDVAFGAVTKPALKPISWDSFQKSFLPHQAGAANGSQSPCCGIAVQGGLLRKIGEEATDLGIVNAKQLVLVTNSLIPSSAATIGNERAITTLHYEGDRPVPFQKNGTPIAQAQTADRREIGAVGIAPMALRQIESTHTISIVRVNDRVETPVEDEFAYTPVTKNVPAALWGGALSPDLNGKQFVEHALSGFEIRPLKEAKADEPVPAIAQPDDETLVPDAFSWELPQQSASPDESKVKAAIAALLGGEQ